MKRGKHWGAVIFLVLVFSLSMVSASFFGDLYDALFGGVPVGQVTGGVDSCFDSDGIENFATSGYVTLNGNTYYDRCDVADRVIDYECVWNEGQDTIFVPSPSEAQLGLALLTGKVTDVPSGEWTLGSSSYDCSLEGKPCVNGRCGCEQGTSISCGPEEGDVGECSLGTQVCDSTGSWGSCTGAVWPELETCDGKDNDCDGQTDEGTTICPSGFFCDANLARCVPGGGQEGGDDCIDEDGDGYSSSSRTDCGPVDCDDSDASVYPGALELCDGTGVDNDCDGVADENDAQADSWCATSGLYGTGYSCTRDEFSGNEAVCTLGAVADQCVDLDGDGYWNPSTSCSVGLALRDCDDSDANVYPGAEEICDGLDNNCDGSVDVTGANEPLTEICGNTITGACAQGERTCVGGSWDYSSCDVVPSYVGPASEVCDGLDNDCDGSTDEGLSCGCTNGATRTCTTEDVCEVGEQTCVGGEWSVCEVVGAKPDCNEDNCEEAGFVSACGTSAGICWAGKKTCGSDLVWSACVGEVKGTDEICSNSLDDDCDGNVDESACVVFALATSSSSGGGATASTSSSGGASQGSSSSGGSSLSGGSLGSTTTSPGGSATSVSGQVQSRGFFELIWAFFRAIFNLGSSLAGHTISDAGMRPTCTDSDLGKNYFQQGAGEGLSQTEQAIWFDDFCYKGAQSNKLDECAGDDCYLKEYYCSGSYVKSETQVVCQYGCANGACIPDASLSKDCQHFDKDLWKWVNVC